jgi:hypothetical protein
MADEKKYSLNDMTVSEYIRLIVGARDMEHGTDIFGEAAFGDVGSLRKGRLKRPGSELDYEELTVQSPIAKAFLRREADRGPQDARTVGGGIAANIPVGDKFTISPSAEMQRTTRTPVSEGFLKYFSDPELQENQRRVGVRGSGEVLGGKLNAGVGRLYRDLEFPVLRGMEGRYADVPPQTYGDLSWTTDLGRGQLTISGRGSRPRGGNSNYLAQLGYRLPW